MIPSGVVQSLDANGKNPVGCTLTSTSDVWSINYDQLLLQPIFIAANTLNELRFLATSTTITILNQDGSFCWAGFCDLVPDPIGWTGVETIVPPALMTATGSEVVTLAWDGPGTNLVLDNGSVIPESSVLPPTNYYNSTLPITIANSTTLTTLVPGIIPFQITDQIPGSPVSIKGSGTLQWNSLSDYVTFVITDGGVTLATWTIIGADLKVASTLSNYIWELDIQLNYITIQSSTASIQLIGTITVYDDFVILPISLNTTTTIDTTIINQLNITTQWNAANVNDIFVADFIRVSMNSVTAGATITVPNINIDGGQPDSIYGGSTPINGGTP